MEITYSNYGAIVINKPFRGQEDKPPKPMSLTSLYTILWHDSSELQCLTFTSQINSLQIINCWTLDSGNLIYNIYHEHDLLISIVRCLVIK
jgi:hypothetical protein